MASLQPMGAMLETSCGSPHYACPEVSERLLLKVGDEYATCKRMVSKLFPY